MSQGKDFLSIKDTFGRLFPLLEQGLYERSRELRTCMLAALAGESVFLMGPPGTAKSLLARRLQGVFAQARCFDYLMGRFSTPEELFGPLSIKALKDEDRLLRRTQGYLPEADIVFLDEIWKASPPIQNLLLTALNERIFRNGDQEFRLPLKLLLAASNEGPPDETAQAFWDRFLIRLHVGPLKHPDNARRLLQDQDDPYGFALSDQDRISPAAWETWRASCAAVALDGPALEILVSLRSEYARLHQEGKAPYISDRRWKKAAGLVRAAAACHDRSTAFAGDTWVVLDTLWNEPAEYDTALELWSAMAARTGSGPGLKELEAAFLDLEAAFQGGSTSQALVDAEEPVLVEDEYLILDLEGRKEEIRIWKDDFERLGADRTVPVEVFLYRQGSFEETREIPCRRQGWELELPQGLEPKAPLAKTESGRIRTRMVQVRTSAKAPADPALVKELETRRVQVLDRIAQAKAGLKEELSLARTRCEEHFFLPAHHAPAILSIPARELEALSRLEEKIHGLCRS